MIKNHGIDILNPLLYIFDVESLIRYGGLLIVIVLIYGSAGLFFFFVPTGALLFAAGLFTASGVLQYDILTVCGLLTLASFSGCVTGYWLGWKAGPLLYKKEDSRFFKKRHLTTAESFYKKYGWMALTLGLYLPIIRTFVSAIAGIVRLDLRRFALLTFIGSLVSVVSFVLPGYLVGRMPALKSSLKYFIPVFIVIVTIPLVIWLVKELKKMRRENKGKGQK